jgi:hypothetical protein
MKYSFWDITPRNALKVSRRFGETCYLHFQDGRINHCEAGGNRRLTFNGLHGIVYIFITTAVRTSDPGYKHNHTIAEVQTRGKTYKSS